MLKFLTHKLRTHSLNEDHSLQNKAQEDDHDSGTESDEEHADSEAPESIMESEADRSSGTTASPFPGSLTAACSPTYFLDSALPSDSDHNYDHHSSEEELEVINSPSNCAAAASNKPVSSSKPIASIGLSSAAPEKRKWSQIGHSSADVVARCVGTARLMLVAEPSSSSGSSDEEVQGLLAAMATPVQFRSSPPLDAHKPGRSLSPPPKLFHYGAGAAGCSPSGDTHHNSSLVAAAAEVSPRKRHRHTPRAHNIQRPCLDFEKMQQLKARAVTAWRHSGDHGGELSVFCW